MTALMCSECFEDLGEGGDMSVTAHAVRHQVGTASIPVEKRYMRMAGRPFVEATEAHPFKVYVQLLRENPATNALAYETIEDAKTGGRELLSRWFAPIGFEVRNELTGEVVS